MCPIDCGLWCWDATTLAVSDDAPSQRQGWRGVLSFSFEVGMRQGRLTLPCKSLRGVRAPNTRECSPAPAPPPCRLAHIFPLSSPLVIFCRLTKDRLSLLACHNGSCFLLVEEAFLSLLYMIFMPVCVPGTGTNSLSRILAMNFPFVSFGFKVLFLP